MIVFPQEEWEDDDSVAFCGTVDGIHVSIYKTMDPTRPFGKGYLLHKLDQQGWLMRLCWTFLEIVCGQMGPFLLGTITIKFTTWISSI